MAGDFVKILYGTTNQAKLQAMRHAVEALGISLIGLNEIRGGIPKVNECGKTMLENAEIKAKAYSGLYFDEVKEEEQPGLYVRRVNGRELSDDEMLEYYSSLAGRYGGKITGQYRNAIYFMLDENHCYSSMDKSIATEPFILSAVPHPKRVAGFPLDSLSIDIASGRYYYDLNLKDVSSSVDDGVKAFFEEALLKFNRR